MSIVRKLYQSVYFRHVLTLLSGTMVAQLVSVLIAPVLTRLYSPEDFGPLALFVAIVAALVPGISGRYDVAIVAAKTEQEKVNLVFISIWITIALCLFFFLVLLGAFNSISDLFSAGVLGYWLWATPIALFLTALITIFRSYANSHNEYKVISKSAVLQTTGVGLLSVTLGIAGVNSTGLLLGNILGLVVTCIYLIIRYRCLFSDCQWKWAREKFNLAIRHKDYLIFNAPTSILNGVMSGLPIFFLAKYYTEAAVGSYMLLARVGVVPLSFIAEAVSRVNFKTLSDQLLRGGNPLKYLFRATGVLTVIATPPMVVLMLFGPDLFALVFGEEWRLAGELLVILMPALALQFVVSSLSLGFIAAGRIRLLALWQFISLILTILVFGWFSQGSDIQHFFWAFAAKDIALYSLYYGMLVYSIMHPSHTLRILPVK